jgi:predicted ATPase
MVLNEPEASLHPDLLDPLARLVTRAAARSQVIVVSHAETLIAALEREAGCGRIMLEKHLGETIVRDRSSPAWKWPQR